MFSRCAHLCWICCHKSKVTARKRRVQGVLPIVFNTLPRILLALSRPAQPRKRLPRGSSQVRSNEAAVAQKPRRSGITANWKLQALWEPEVQDASHQVISEEEQKKLAALDLEMRLPRIAGKIDPWLLIITLTLLCIGLVMVYSASSFVAARDYGDAAYFFQRQLLSVILGVIVLFVTMRVDYRQWRRFSLIGLLITLPLLLYVLKFGRAEYGASRWIAFACFSLFQPSELVKLVLALYIADWLARQGQAGRNISLRPRAVCDPGGRHIRAGVVGKRYGNGGHYRRAGNRDVFHGGGQYYPVSASDGLWRVNFLNGGVKRLPVPAYRRVSEPV